MKNWLLLLLVQTSMYAPYTTKDAQGKSPEELSALVKTNIAHLRKQRACIGCYLVGAHLPGENLQGVNLENADLTGVYAPGASFNLANLAGARLDSAYLPGADLTGIQTSETTSFIAAYLANTALQELKEQTHHATSENELGSSFGGY